MPGTPTPTELLVRVRAGDRAAFDDLYERLSGYDERLGQLVEYRFFGG